MLRGLLRLTLLISLCFATAAAAQDTPDSPLLIESPQVVTRTDPFGVERQAAVGTLRNTSTDTAYANLVIYADLLDADGTPVGEGFGGLVNACGTGLPPDFALQPGQAAQFALRLELYDADDFDDIAYFPEGSAQDPEPVNPFLNFADLTTVTRDEVVMVEWLTPPDNAGDEFPDLRYATGCDADAFTFWDWTVYDVDTGTARALNAHPQAANITEDFLERAELSDPTIYRRSYISFHPDATRAIYQTALNTVLTIEPDASFKRLLLDDLGRFSLHGFIWMPDGLFLAYYYGAYGEPVRYFTGSVAGQVISQDVPNVTPSLTVPGPTPSGAQVVIGAEIDGVPGYYLSATTGASTTLLLAVDSIESLPGNHYPAPLYVPDPAGDRVYIVRPGDSAAAPPRLVCVRRGDAQTDPETRAQVLTNLPLRLTPDDRAWAWLSSDGTTLALAANGIHGGLWLVDLTQYAGCTPAP